jgi:phosphoesterase RecJ-like protein
MDYARALAELKRSRHVTLTTHVKADSDGLACIAVLRRWLQGLGKSVEIVLPTQPPARYASLGLDDAVRVAGRDVRAEDVRVPDLLCIVDTGTWQQLSGLEPLVKACRGRVLVIDHHQTQDDLADVRLVDAEAPAAAVLVHRLLQEAGARLDATSASWLLAGLGGDTDWFQLPNVTAAALRLAADLVEAGAVPWEVYDRLYRGEPLAKMRLLGMALAGLRPALGGRAVVMRLTRAMFRDVGTSPVDTEKLINECMRVSGVEAAVMLVEAEGGEVRASLRSRPGVDVRRVAERFGGGGHTRAAGMRLKGTMDEAETRVLAALDEALAAADKAEKA